MRTSRRLLVCATLAGTQSSNEILKLGELS
jgi:hypothetical protein